MQAWVFGREKDQNILVGSNGAIDHVSFFFIFQLIRREKFWDKSIVSSPE